MSLVPFAAALLLALAVWRDAQANTIPNSLSIGVALLAICYALSADVGSFITRSAGHTEVVAFHNSTKGSASDNQASRAEEFPYVGVESASDALTGQLAYLFQHVLEVPFKAAALLFIGGFLLWKAGIMGAGDVKLITACALWFPDSLGAFLFVTASLGGVLALAMLALAWVRKSKLSGVPYGVAIGLAGIACLVGRFSQ